MIKWPFAGKRPCQKKKKNVFHLFCQNVYHSATHASQFKLLVGKHLKMTRIVFKLKYS